LIAQRENTRVNGAGRWSGLGLITGDGGGGGVGDGVADVPPPILRGGQSTSCHHSGEEECGVHGVYVISSMFDVLMGVIVLLVCWCACVVLIVVHENQGTSWLVKE